MTDTDFVPEPLTDDEILAQLLVRKPRANFSPEQRDFIKRKVLEAKQVQTDDEQIAKDLHISQYLVVDMKMELVNQGELDLDLYGNPGKKGSSFDKNVSMDILALQLQKEGRRKKRERIARQMAAIAHRPPFTFGEQVWPMDVWNAGGIIREDD